MDAPITNIQTNGNITTCLLLSDDISLANMYRRAILSEIDTYAIDIVIFNINTSPRHDEVIALRLGQLPIDHSRFVPPEEGNFKTTISFEGPGEFTTEHIPNLPFKRVTPIAELRAGQKIECDVIVKRGQGKQHVKWRPVSKVIIQEAGSYFTITIKDTDMLSGPEILRMGYEKIATATRRDPLTIFFRPVIPEGY
jgi:DNA-directed RNA polymerase alpha subunit